MKKIIMAILISVCLISTAYGVEYSANVISIAIPRSSAAVGTNRVTTFNQSTY